MYKNQPLLIQNPLEAIYLYLSLSPRQRRNIFTYFIFLASSLNSVDMPFLSISAAHRAAPTVFVNENASDAKGTISKMNAVMPKL